MITSKWFYKIEIKPLLRAKAVANEEITIITGIMVNTDWVVEVEEIYNQVIPVIFRRYRQEAGVELEPGNYMITQFNPL